MAASLSQADVDALRAALDGAAARARAPRSDFHVGAACLDEAGRIHPGANLEWVEGPLSATLHAEQAAILHAWMNDAPPLVAVATSEPPCGHCRQFMRELYGAEALQVVTRDAVVPLGDLLPDPLTPADLGNELPLFHPDRERGAVAELDDDPAVRAAVEAWCRSYAPYTGDCAGVALVDGEGRVATGTYVESVAFNPSVPALVAALGLAPFQGVDPDAIARCILVVEGDDRTHVEITETFGSLAFPGAEYEIYELG